MSEYLNNLAARALRRQDSVRPRLASLYEPPNGALASLPAGPSDVETTSFGHAADAPSTIRTPAPHLDSHPPAHETAAPPLAHGSPRADAFEGETGREGREFGPSAPDAPRARASAGESQPHFTPVEREVEAPPPRRPRAETPRRAETVRHETRVAEAADASGRATDASAGVEDRVQELEGRVASLEALRADAKGREALRAAPGALVPVTARPYTPAVAPPRAVEPMDEPPRVIVTIGRVDVRAIFPAPAPAPRAPAPRPGPTTTLAEYLKQRERGPR